MSPNDPLPSRHFLTWADAEREFPESSVQWDFEERRAKYPQLTVTKFDHGDGEDELVARDPDCINIPVAHGICGCMVWDREKRRWFYV